MARLQNHGKDCAADDLNPAKKLVGKELPNGWKVEELINRPEGASGGHFSTSYIVRSSDGKVAFLKAMDYKKALGSQDPARTLQMMTAAYNFERDLMEKCKSRRLSRVVKILDSGTLHPQEGDPSSVVQYLIMELADRGDIRSIVTWGQNLETAWILRTMHQTAAAIRQLHAIDIAHQDVKPSNVVVFEGNHSKLADLGRAYDRHSTAPHDESVCAGDQTYAPPELLYGYVLQDWRARRLGCDLYHLGSLIVFFCTQASMTHILSERIAPKHRWDKWGGTYAEVLPYLQHYFVQVVREIQGNIRIDFADEIAEQVKQLCNPDHADTELRGHPKNIMYGGDQYSLERYVSTFDRLAKRAEWSLRRSDPISLRTPRKVN